MAGAANWSQADQRRGQVYRDQHGRKWFATVEKRTGHPCGAINPKFSAPLIPDQKYLKLSADSEKSNELVIDYDQWIGDLSVAREEYRKEITQVCLAREWPIPKGGVPLPQNVTDIVGPGPKPLEPVVAAMQGNPWILGFTEKADPRLSHLITKRRARIRAVNLEEFPDYSQLPSYDDVEEEHDPDATGGKTEPVGQKRRGRPPKAANVEA